MLHTRGADVANAHWKWPKLIRRRSAREKRAKWAHFSAGQLRPRDKPHTHSQRREREKCPRITEYWIHVKWAHFQRRHHRLRFETTCQLLL